MTKSKNLLSTLAVALLLSACGSGTAEKAEDNTAKTEQAAVEDTTSQEATKLVATPINKAKAVADGKMVELKDKLKKGVSDWQRGRVQFLNLEGGFYGIITDSGQKILPLNMTKEFAQNGAIVRIKGKAKNIMTIQQWGTPFVITEIELIKPGSKTTEADM